MDSGKVTCFQNAEIDRLQKVVAEEHGYELVDKNIVLYVKEKGSE